MPHWILGAHRTKKRYIHTCIAIDLSVGDDLHVHGVLAEESVDGWKIGPEVVRVEYLELGDRLEFINMSFGYLQCMGMK